MRKTTYKVPVKLTREGASVRVTQDDTKKEKVKSEDLGEGTKNILTLSKEISDHNSKQISIAQMVMAPNQAELETFIALEYLEE